MKNYTAEFAAKFKRNYAYTMGGSQTIELPNGQKFEFNDRQFYSGRGSKYNNSVKHDNKGIIKITRKELSAVLKSEREVKARLKAITAERKETAKRYADNKEAGIYGISVEKYGNYIELSEAESEGQYFDAPRLAKTLGISLKDAELLKSYGKTYVFAKTNTGEVIELYHSSLSCNSLSISISKPNAERIAEFNHDEWASAPYAEILGQSKNENHFVC